MLRLAKFHSANCAKTSSKYFKCKCPFTVIGPDPRPTHQGKRYKRCLDTADHLLAKVKVGDIEKSFILEPDSVEPIKISEAVQTFLSTKKSVSPDRQRKLRRILGSMSGFWRQGARALLIRLRSRILMRSLVRRQGRS